MSGLAATAGSPQGAVGDESALAGAH